MMRCNICGRITKPNEATGYRYTTRPLHPKGSKITGQKQVCMGCV